MTNPLLHKIAAEIEVFAGMTESLAVLEDFTVKLMASRLPYYNWVGFYWLDPDDAEMLVLGAYAGAPTEHTRIPVSRGICGAAVAEDKTIIVDDVAADPRYLACSIETRSEMVAPIHVRGKIAGEIDIDSHSAAAFGPEDQAFLERCARVIGAFMERTQLS
jgi:GAF domain-containing protein